MAVADRIEIANGVLPMETAAGIRDVPVVVFRFGAQGQYPYPAIVVPAETSDWELVGALIAQNGAAAMAAVIIEDLADEEPAPEAVLCSGCGRKLFGDELTARGICYGCQPKGKDE